MTAYLRPPIQGPRGVETDVAMGYAVVGGQPPADAFLADGRRVQPDPAYNVIVVDAKDVGSLQRAGWVLMPTPTAGVSPFTTVAATQAFITIPIVDYAGTSLYGKVGLGGQAPAGAVISGLAVAATMEGASAPFGTAVTGPDGAWRISYASNPRRVQSVSVSVAGSYAGAVTYTPG